jgi:hypothetical protein
MHHHIMFGLLAGAQGSAIVHHRKCCVDPRPRLTERYARGPGKRAFCENCKISSFFLQQANTQSSVLLSPMMRSALTVIVQVVKVL